MRLAPCAAFAALLCAPSAFALSYPSDCKAATLRSAGSKNGCTVVNGAKHHKVMKNGKQVTLIPNTVKQNGTCRSIINELNAGC
jgi:hypothetical protein